MSLERDVIELLREIGECPEEDDAELAAEPAGGADAANGPPRLPVRPMLSQTGHLPRLSLHRRGLRAERVREEIN